MSSYDEDYEAMRRKRREAVEKKRMADYQAEVKAVERAAKPPPEPLVVTPWGTYTASQLVGMGQTGPDGRIVINLQPPAVPPPPPAPWPPPPAPVSAPPASVAVSLAKPEPEAWRPGARPGRAWLGHYADAHDKDEEALLPEATPGHTLVVGATRMGKTRLLLLLAGEALASGASIATLDLKNAHFTLGRLCGVAHAAGLAPGDLSLFLPSVSPGPGWNPLLEGPEAVDEFLEVFKGLAQGSWGPKMDLLFRGALALLASRRLSLFELRHLVENAAYAKGLASPAGSRSEQEEYLLGRVAGRDADADPVLNKVIPVVDRDYFKRCLCAERNTFSMGSLWQRRQLACFHLDRVRLGEDGAKALGALAARRLFTASIEPPGPGRVILMADEAGEVDKLSGGQMERTLSQGGESRLSLMLACQLLSQLPTSLRESALTNTSLKCFFQIGPKDVKSVDEALGDGWGSRAASLGKQHCLVQVGKSTPRVVRVADLDPPPPPEWENQGQRLAPDEWDGMPARRREAVQKVLGKSLPRLDAAPKDWDRDGLS